MRTLKDALKLELDEQPLFYMSRPRHFDIAYDINPWMAAHVNKGNNAKAVCQFKALVKELRSTGAEVRIITCTDASLPDATFIANAGSFIPFDGKYVFVPSMFKNSVRYREAEFFSDEFTWEGATCSYMIPAQFPFEGDGDLLRLDDKIIMGHGFRSTLEAHEIFKNYFPEEQDCFVTLELVDPFFYHLDTCFFYHRYKGRQVCIFYPAAFKDTTELKQILSERNIFTIEVDREDALRMSCNAVGSGDTIIMSQTSENLRSKLTTEGWRLVETDLSEFHKSGGSAKCLTLRVPRSAL